MSMICGLMATVPLATNAQNTVKGVVINGQEPIYSAKIQLENTYLGTYSNANGEFKLEGVSNGDYHLIVSAEGFEDYFLDLNVQGDLVLKVEMMQAPQMIEAMMVQVIKADAKIQGGDISALVGGNLIGGGLDSAFSLGYPDTCKFKLLLQKNATGDTSLTELFTSEFCVIENVAVDYGSQNKMVFFSSGADKKYYPSEVTVTINLRETSLPTTGTLGNERTSINSEYRTIF